MINNKEQTANINDVINNISDVTKFYDTYNTLTKKYYNKNFSMNHIKNMTQFEERMNYTITRIVKRHKLWTITNAYTQKERTIATTNANHATTTNY